MLSDVENIFRIAVRVMGWNAKSDDKTPFPRVSIQHGSYILVESGVITGEGRRHFSPLTSHEDALNVLTHLPKPNAVVVDEARGFRVAGGNWAGEWSLSFGTAVVTAATNYLDTKDVVPTTFHMTMARASQKDFDDTLKFLTQIDNVLEYGSFEGEDEDEAQWLDEEATARKIGQWVMENRNLLFGWGRVVWGFDTLLREVCDPSLSYLDYKPDFALMKAWARAAAIRGSESDTNEPTTTTD